MAAGLCTLHSCRSGLPGGEAEGVNLARGQMLEHRGRKGALGPGRQGQVALGQVGHQDSGMLPLLQWDWPLVSGKKCGVCVW